MAKQKHRWGAAIRGILRMNNESRLKRTFGRQRRVWLPSARAPLTVVAIVLLSVAGFWPLQGGLVTEPQLTASVMAATTAMEPEPLKTIVDSFARNSNVTDALLQHGLDRKEVLELVQDAMPVYNLAKVAAGRPYWLEVTSEGALRTFRYPLDDERYLTVFHQVDHFVPVIKKFPFETRLELVTGTVRDSLISAVTDAGEEDLLALDLAEIFMWDVDFYTELQPGDSFRVLVEKKFLDGKFVKYGNILAARLMNQGRNLTAFRFENRPGSPEYFSADGKALKKSFLKSPLKYARVTSRFSNARMHPILRIVRPHLGVDYAAPVGTPVVSVAAGTVVSAGSTAQGGKTVHIRHAGAYTTYYQHLRRIAVRVGTPVAQNQVIGYVGTTGLSTGPHLDFRITQHGKFVNPLKIIFPPSPPVSSENLTRFEALRLPLQEKLDGSVPELRAER